MGLFSSVGDGKAVFTMSGAAECRVTDLRTCGKCVQGNNGQDLSYIQLQCNDNPNLECLVSTCTRLTLTPWIKTAYTVTGANVAESFHDEFTVSITGGCPRSASG